MGPTMGQVVADRKRGGRPRAETVPRLRRRDLLFLHLYLDVEMTIDEIAEQFDLTPRGVRKMIARARTYGEVQPGPKDEDP